jgi:apolipoprotein D and lipocalin family protein
MKHKKWSRRAFLTLIFSGVLGSQLVPAEFASAHVFGSPVQTVDSVEVPRYLGKWYEIASIPQWFSRGCTNTTATYALRANGEIDVDNQCLKVREDGTTEPSQARGVAYAVDSTNSKLKVSFVNFFGLRLFAGDYWILGLGPTNRRGQYSWVAVGHPYLNSGWILARQPRMSRSQMRAAIRVLEANGYDMTRFEMQRHGVKPN